MCYIIGSQGMIWWWILLSAYCHLSNSPQEMFTARKHKIVSLKPTHFRVLMSPHIPFTLTMACTYSFTMLPYSSANTHGIPHYWFTRCAPFSLTKGHGIWANHPIFLLCTMIRCLFWGMTGRGGLFERPLCRRVGEVRAYGTIWGIFGISSALLVPA